LRGVREVQVAGSRPETRRLRHADPLMENPQMPQQIDRAIRLELMKFVCTFAWADLSVHPAERSFVSRLVRRLGFDAEEQAQVQEWLLTPPPPESVDPTRIPRTHRKVFLAAIDGVIAADGEISPEERESLALLKELMDA
jgi:uncharacterized tellurite resistance protein B-like protein